MRMATAHDRGLVRPASEQVLDADLGMDDRLAQPLLTADSPGEPCRSLLVTPATPRRIWPAQADGADDENHRDEQADKPSPDLALQHGDPGQHEHQCRDQDEANEVVHG